MILKNLFKNILHIRKHSMETNIENFNSIYRRFKKLLEKSVVIIGKQIYLQPYISHICYRCGWGFVGNIDGCPQCGYQHIERLPQ